MKVARYIGGGEIAVVDEPVPECPPGGLLVRTEASGLCSGELMDWYMDRKIPHVLGHEVAGIVVESEEPGFPVGTRVFAHHHAACGECEMCRKGLHVHCAQWKRTRLLPGGMAEYFAVSADNLDDAFSVDELRPVDAALIEPLACVMKSVTGCGALARAIGTSGLQRGRENPPTAVIGLGSMGLMHMLVLPHAVGYDLSESRLEHARAIGLDARHPSRLERADLVFVCPGNKTALDLAIELSNPGATIVLFAPMPPGAETPVDLNKVYFSDLRLVSSYSCGPHDTNLAAKLIGQGRIKAEQVVSDFISIDELPAAYQKMKRGDILKAMVVF